MALRLNLVHFYVFSPLFCTNLLPYKLVTGTGQDFVPRGIKYTPLSLRHQYVSYTETALGNLKR